MTEILEVCYLKNFFKSISKFIKEMSTQKKVALSIGIFFLAIILTTVGYYLHVRGKIYVSASSGSFGEKIDYSDVPMEAPLYEEQKGITNILLIGTDARNIDEPSRSDSIIIATIDDNNRNIKFTSIMRDSYVEIPKHKTQKINAAYQMGGPELLMKTIEMNFRIKLDKYIIVNFWGFEDIIDTVGGIEVDVKEHEINEINKYIGETREVKSPPLTSTGYQKLDGQQALAYARIRKTDSEYNRTERQREVLGLLANKLKSTSVISYPKVMESMLGCVRTNIEPAALLNYAYTVSQFEPLVVNQLQIPVNEISWGGMYNGAWVLLMDRTQNAKVMNDFVFTNKTTTKEELDLKAFNDVIKEYKSKSVKVDHENTDPSLDTTAPNDNDSKNNTDKNSTKNTSDNTTTGNDGGKTGTGTSNTGGTGSNGETNSGSGTGTTGSGGSGTTGTGSTGTNNTGTGNAENGAGNTGTGGTSNGNTGTSGTGGGTSGTGSTTSGSGGTNTGNTGTSGTGSTGTGTGSTVNTDTTSGNPDSNTTNNKTTN